MTASRRSTSRRQVLLAGSLGVLGAAAPRAWAQGKTLRIVVPFTPGGSTDILARALSQRLALALGQTVLIDNRPGAGGSIGAAEVARAELDGNTLLMGHIGTLGVNPSMYPKLAYDPLTSFAPVAWVARVPNVLVVSSASPWRSLKDLIAAARARPGALSYSSGGNGSAAHIAMEYLKLKAKFPMLHIPYRGTAPSVADVVGGQVDATFTGSPAVLPLVKAGRLRALAVSSVQRLPQAPDVPTVAESGYPGFEADQWYGLVAPAGVAPARIAQLNAEVNRALGQADVAQQLAGEGAVPTPTDPKAFGDLIRREIPRWAEVVKAGNIKPD